MQVADVHSVTLYVPWTARGCVRCRTTLRAGHYAHITQKTYTHRTTPGGRGAGIVGRRAVGRMRSSGTRLCTAASRLCTAAAPAAGLCRAGRRGRGACDRSAAALTGIRAAAVPRRRVSLDAGLLGLGRRILLGARNLGAAAAGRRALDSGLLGLRRRRICVQRWLLGTSRRILRRCQLWLRIRRGGLCRRPLGGQFVCLQSVRQQRERDQYSQHVQPDRSQQCHGQ